MISLLDSEEPATVAVDAHDETRVWDAVVGTIWDQHTAVYDDDNDDNDDDACVFWLEDQHQQVSIYVCPAHYLSAL